MLQSGRNFYISRVAYIMPDIDGVSASSCL